jgi:hypothetical protein
VPTKIRPAGAHSPNRTTARRIASQKAIRRPFIGN